MPRGYGSIGRPKGQSNPKNHKAGGKREGSGRKKIQPPMQSNKLLSYFSATNSNAEESVLTSAPNNNEISNVEESVATSAPHIIVMITRWYLPFHDT